MSESEHEFLLAKKRRKMLKITLSIVFTQTNLLVICYIVSRGAAQQQAAALRESQRH
jgi:hypothetical protein